MGPPSKVQQMLSAGRHQCCSVNQYFVPFSWPNTILLFVSCYLCLLLVLSLPTYLTCEAPDRDMQSRMRKRSITKAARLTQKAIAMESAEGRSRLCWFGVDIDQQEETEVAPSPAVLKPLPPSRLLLG